MAIPFQSRGDIDAVAHQVAVALLDDIAQMNADAELDAALGRQAGVALDHAVLHLDGAAHGVDHAAELDEDAVAGALDHAPVMHGDGRIDQIAAQRPQPRQGAILVRAGEPAVSDHIGRQYRRELPGLGHEVPSYNPERDGEFWPAEMQEGYHALNRTSVTFFTVVRRRKAHSFLRREMSPSGPFRPSLRRINLTGVGG